MSYFLHRLESVTSNLWNSETVVRDLNYWALLRVSKFSFHVSKHLELRVYTQQTMVGHCRQGRSKHGRRSFGNSCEDCYAREISRFVCNKVRFFKLDDSGNCIIRKTWLHCIWFEKKFRLNEVIPHCTRSVNCRLGLQHFNEYHAYEYSLMNKSINKVLADQKN